MTTVQLNSSAIRQLQYDEDTSTLVITFAKSGSETLRGISKKQFDAFKSAPSPGLYYNQHLKGS
jgi:hypothetical protein